jgi:hypothetical protein
MAYIAMRPDAGSSLPDFCLISDISSLHAALIIKHPWNSNNSDTSAPSPTPTPFPARPSSVTSRNLLFLSKSSSSRTNSALVSSIVSAVRCA